MLTLWLAVRFEDDDDNDSYHRNRKRCVTAVVVVAGSASEYPESLLTALITTASLLQKSKPMKRI